MIRTAIKGMLARKLRTVLTGLAIVLGVAMVSAAYILTDTWQGAADKLSTAAYDNVDAVVTTRAAFEVAGDQAGGKRPPLPASVLADVRSLPQVGVAAGDVSDEVRLVGHDGKAIGGDGGSPSFAEGIDARTPGAAALSPFKLRSGRFARADREVTIDAATAKKEHLAVGQTIGVSTHGALAAVHDRGDRDVRVRRVAGRRDGRDLRPAPGAGADRQARQARLHPGSCAGRRGSRRAAARHRVLCCHPDSRSRARRARIASASMGSRRGSASCRSSWWPSASSRCLSAAS